MESKVKYFIHGNEVLITDVYLDEWGRVIVHVCFQNDGHESDYYYECLEIVEVSECTLAC